MNFFKWLFKKKEQPKRVQEPKNVLGAPFYSIGSTPTTGCSQNVETNDWENPFANSPFSFGNSLFPDTTNESTAPTDTDSFGGFGGGDGGGGGAGGSWDTDTGWDTSSNDYTSTSFD